MSFSSALGVWFGIGDSGEDKCVFLVCLLDWDGVKFT